MVFSSELFLFLFLPVTLLLYFLTPSRWKNLTLLIASLIFYSWGESKAVFILLLSSFIDYAAALVIDKGYRKLGLYASIVSNLCILGFFKYLNFTFDNFEALLHLLGIQSTIASAVPHIVLPVGISFFTFQTMSYTIDVYRGEVKANRNFIDYAAYVTMFPQLVAGPIVRYADINKQLISRHLSIANFSDGVERFIIGLVKKVIIANTFATIADDVFKQDISLVSTPFAWLGIIAYSIQIYYDFSGYSDMAIGLGKMLGFDFIENFNYPYVSKSIREFWRRWHISLSSWFRDYLYVPLGGSRKGVQRTYLNLLIVFFITGLWHGASWNFVIWGLFHGLFIIIERMGFDRILERSWKPVQHLYALLVAVSAWVFFRTDTPVEAWHYLSKMFAFDSGDYAMNSYLSYYHVNYHVFTMLVIAIVFSTPVYPQLSALLEHTRIVWLRTTLVFAAFLVAILYLSAGTYNPFIYFRF